MNLPLIGNQASTAETTGAAQFVHPFGPFWIQSAIGLFILWLEYSQTFLKRDK